MGIFDDIINGKEPTIIEETEDLTDSSVFVEATYPDVIPYIKVTTRKVFLPIGTPKGRGNLCFLYNNSIEESFAQINTKANYISGNNYYFYYYTPIYQGKLYTKRYRIREIEERKAIYDRIEKETKLHPYLQLNVKPNENRNMYFELSRYLNIFYSICDNLPPSRKISTYWDYLKQILTREDLKGYGNRFVLIDITKFKMTKVLKENLNNPLYMIYYTLYKKYDYMKGLDIDFIFFSGLKTLKINPSKLKYEDVRELRTQMERLFKTIPKDVLKAATDENTIKKAEAVEETISKISSTMEDNEEEKPLIEPEAKQPEIKKKEELKGETKEVKEVERAVVQKVNNVKREIETLVPDVTEVPQETLNKVIQTKVENEISDDKELISKIYDQSVGKKLPKKTFSSERDKKLKEEQKNVKVGNMTIQDIEKIKASKINIPVHDVSKAVKTVNKNMTQIRFDNIEKEYNKKLMPKDITDAILSLNDKSIPMFVRKIDVTDSSDELNYKDTYTIYLEDANRKRHTVKVDIPKFIEDRFIYIGGNRKIIKKQTFLYPVVKISPSTVQVVTNYNKMTVERVGTKSIASIERLKKLLKAEDSLKEYFTFGNAENANSKFITTIEYDEISSIAFRYKYKKAEFYFDQNEAQEIAKKKEVKIPKDHLFVGFDKDGKPVLIHHDIQKTKDGKTIVEKMVESFPQEMQDKYGSIKAPARLIYTRVMTMSKPVAVGLLLGFWEGLESILKKGNVKYRLEEKYPDNLGANENVLRFSDCFLVYESDTKIDLLLNGFRLIDTKNYTIAQMNDQEAYIQYLIKVYGRAAITNALMNQYEFMIDPITLEVLKDLNLPTDIVSLIIYAVSLLADSQYTSEINQNLSRIRSNEIIPAILYERLAKNYILYRNSNGRKKFSVPQDCVIKELLAVKTVEDYSTLNPVLELEMMHGVSSKGFRGVNLEESYTLEKRSYDPSMVGTISPSTSPDGSCGVNRTLTLEPPVTSLRGYVDTKEDDLKSLKDVNLFSPGELSIPLAAHRDDPTRLGHALKQSKHAIPVKKSSPVLISNGMEEVCRFHLSSDFVINADEDGEIVDYDEESKIMIAKYKSGKCRAINLSGTIVKNGGGGFFLSNKLITPLKVGSKFKKDDVLAYHKDFFTNDKFNNCRMNMGPLVKIALMSTYNTYQDATMITEKMSEDAATEMCFRKPVVIGKNANIEYIVNEGDKIEVGESLVQFDTSYDDNSLNNLLAALSETDQHLVMQGSRNDVPSKYSGVIEEIKIYSTVPVDELSPSLRKVVRKYYNKINRKKEFLEKYDPESKNSIVKCGLLVDESTNKIEPNKFSVLKGEKIDEGVLIEFYIKHSEPLEIGSKIANFTALKNTIGEVIPKGYEPYSEFRPDEEVGTIIASNSILKRMTPSVILTTLGNKNIVELKRRLKEIYDS